ncbi:unnamed protein product [Periconia digitata]|uniref:FabD/lysophospholipase-like protein n=1 Tax=Periconia digitata TaxID=1303443 RepID=A0A9W4UI63_9PLEO|nr:unnamed protein product [Periconia digitata]
MTSKVMDNNDPWITFADSGPSGRTISLGRSSAKIQNAKTANALITMIGRRSKATILENIIGVTSFAVQQQIYLRSSSKLTLHHLPVLVADCDVSYRKITQAINPQLTSASWSIPATENATAVFSSRVLAPFSGVVAYFVSDLGGPKSIVQWLAHQASLPPPTNLGMAPIVLLVVETTSDTFDESVAANRFLSQISDAIGSLEGVNELDAHKAINQHFKQITVIGLRSFMANPMRAKVFKRRAIGLLELASNYRRQLSVEFEQRHFHTLARKAIDNLSENGFTTVCFANASRSHGFTLENFPSCLDDLLTQMPSATWLWHVVIPLVASALYLATYPPGSHYFSPDYIFTQLYYSHCEEAIAKYTSDRDIQNRFIFCVLSEFRNIFTDSLKNRVSSAETHRANIEQLQPHLVCFKSHRSCFCCLMRMPEKSMACGHAFCDACIKTHGTRSLFEKNTYIHSACLLCGVSYPNSIFRFVPPTAGIRVLTVDGGGVRGIIPLVFLKHIEQLMHNFDCSIKDYFDYVCGTSAGGLVVIGIFLLQWDTVQSIQQFDDVARKTFKQDKGATIFEKALEMMLAYIKDGKYSLSAIQDAFKATFKSEIKMFNPLQNDTKVAVTTTTVNESTPKLFTNYNGGRRPAELGYDILRAETPGNDASLSDAACCTSAAPWFFKPRHLHKLGTFQDGGLQHNCPSDIADWEIGFLWPEKPIPDYALSLGTGTAFYTTSTLQHRKSYRFLTRLFKNFMRSLDGEDAWRKFYNNRPASTRGRYHRLNVRFSSHEPQLDDVSSLTQLKSQATEAICSTHNDIGLIIDTIKASMFYFELDSMPQFSGSTYNVSGFILCRLDLSVPGRQHLYQNLLDTASWFVVQGNPTRCVDKIPKGWPPFKCRIKFNVESIDEDVYISVRGLTNATHLISGFPTTLKDLINQQRLDSPFGTIDHVEIEKNYRNPLKKGLQTICRYKRSDCAGGRFFSAKRL